MKYDGVVQDMALAGIDAATDKNPPTSRTFDLRTSDERMVMWCASLERRYEDLALRVAYLEMQAHKQSQGPRLSAETLAHRLLNPGEEPEEDDPDD